MIEEDQFSAVRVLRELKVDPAVVRKKVEKYVVPGESEDDTLPFTPRAQKVLDIAREEADKLGHNLVGTEHLLLGLLAEGEGIAAGVLRTFGLKAESLRERLGVETAGATSGSMARPGAGGGDVQERTLTMFTEIRDELKAIRGLLERRDRK